MSVVAAIIIGSLAAFAIVEAFAFGLLKDKRPVGYRTQPE